MPAARRPLVILASSAVLALGAGGAATAAVQHQAATGVGGLARAHAFAIDRAWMGKATELDLAEIQTGTLAQQKGTTDAVKALGARFVADHTRHLARVRALARRAGLPLPATPSPILQWQGTVLGTVSGALFDQGWVTAEVADHQEAILVTRGEIRDGNNAAVRRLARATLPVLRQHLAAAQQLAAPAA